MGLGSSLFYGTTMAYLPPVYGSGHPIIFCNQFGIVTNIKVIDKLTRLNKIAAYNRDWYKYLPPFAADRSQETQLFRLRNGQQLEVPTDARFILNEIYLDRVYDIPSMDYAALDDVLDMGANVELFASYIASHNPKATIHCFEPAESNYLILKRNIERNQIKDGVHEYPLTVYQDRPGHHRHAQLGACVFQELAGLLDHAACNDWTSVVILSHNFELLNPLKTHPDTMVTRRFVQLCRFLDQERERLPTAFFAGLSEAEHYAPQPAIYHSSPLKTGWRMAEQALRRVQHRLHARTAPTLADAAGISASSKLS